MEKRLSDDAIMREMAHMNQVLAREARAVGGTTGAPFALAVLAGHEEAVAEGFASRLLTQAELADAVGIRPQSLGPMLAQLERDGCIERVSCADDRRANLIKLTDRGREKAQDARESQRAFATETLAVLTDDEKASLGSIVVKLNKALG